MTFDVTLLILLAAASHAGWNALIKISGDRIAVMAVVTLAGSLLSILALPFVDGPDPASWPLPRLDTDGDGAISTAELEQLQARIKQRAQLPQPVPAAAAGTRSQRPGDGPAAARVIPRLASAEAAVVPDHQRV
jgi:hypothetical protein